MADRTEFNVDVIVIGGGHAGTEAATGAARVGARVLLVTSALETIGQLSCNPAIGGVAKGTVAREVDALGGLMARATDRSTLQFRMLNRGKGAAVWAPRAQCDRGLYRRAIRSALEEHRGLMTVQGTVARLLIDPAERRVRGIETIEGRRFGAHAVVLTAGTFLRGQLHIGTETRVAGGRAGDAPATHLAEQLEALGITGSAVQDRHAAADRWSLSGLFAPGGPAERDRGLRLLLVALLAHATKEFGANAPSRSTPMLDHLCGRPGEADHPREPPSFRDVRRGDQRTRSALLSERRG